MSNCKKLIEVLFGMVFEPLKAAGIYTDASKPLDIIELAEKRLADTRKKYPKFAITEKDDPLNATVSSQAGWENLLRIFKQQSLEFHTRNLMQITDPKWRINYLISIISGSRSLLWINEGSLNQDLFTEELAVQFKKHMQEKPNLPVILTFAHKKRDGKFTDNPFFRAVKEHPKHLIIGMEERIQNHFILSIGLLGNIKYPVMAIEPIHSEKQQFRFVMFLCPFESMEMEIAILLHHLLSEQNDIHIESLSSEYQLR